MVKKQKGRTDCNQTPLQTTKIKLNFNLLTSHIKGLIVTLALWGLVPVAIAEWLVGREENNDE